MISRALCVLAGLAACGGDAPSARARVLEKIPAGVTTIAVADARALANPRFRPLVDVLRAEIPAGFDCVVDAALAGEQVAVGIAPSGDVTVALVSHAQVKCAVLSAVESDLWIATLGSGAPASGSSAASEQPRARPFLKDAPIALVTQLGTLRVLATAQPAPLGAWVAFDAPDFAAATLFANDVRKRFQAAATNEAIAPVAKALVVEGQGSQVVVRLGATTADLAVALKDALARARGRDVARAFPCPAPFAPPVLSCAAGDHDHNTLDVYSLASAFDEILAARKEVVIQNGRVEGIRLRDELATYGLASGDMLVAVDGQRLTAVEQLAPSLQKAKVRTQLLIARLQRFGTIELVEH